MGIVTPNLAEITEDLEVKSVWSHIKIPRGAFGEILQLHKITGAATIRFNDEHGQYIGTAMVPKGRFVIA